MQISFIPANLLAVLSEAIQNIAKSTFNPNDEIKVWQKTDRAGKSYWCAYDPKTGHSSQFGSEIEVMRWIESRYYF